MTDPEEGWKNNAATGEKPALGQIPGSAWNEHTLGIAWGLLTQVDPPALLVLVPYLALISPTHSKYDMNAMHVAVLLTTTAYHDPSCGPS